MKYEQRITRSKISSIISQRTRNKNIYTAKEDESLQGVLQKIISPDNTERAVAVADKGEKVVALITEKDILKYLNSKINVNTEKTNAIDVANPDFFSVREDENVQAAINKMNDNRVRHALILTADGKYFGWIKREDIVRDLREMLR